MVLLVRKVLNLLYDYLEGSDPKAKFYEMVKALTESWVPKGLQVKQQTFLEQIKKLGNKANHTPELATKNEANLMLRYLDLLMINIYQD